MLNIVNVCRDFAEGMSFSDVRVKYEITLDEAIELHVAYEVMVRIIKNNR